jgi:hypothetical protein
MTKTREEKAAKEIEALSPPERLRLAAGLLEKKQPRLALHIIDNVSAELGAALLLHGREFRALRKA